MFHLFLTVDALLQAPSLWGRSSRSSGTVLQGAQGQAAYVEKEEKAHFGSLPVLTPMPKDECSSPPGTVKKQ